MIYTAELRCGQRKPWRCGPHGGFISELSLEIVPHLTRSHLFQLSVYRYEFDREPICTTIGDPSLFPLYWGSDWGAALFIADTVWFEYRAIAITESTAGILSIGFSPKAHEHD